MRTDFKVFATLFFAFAVAATGFVSCKPDEGELNGDEKEPVVEVDRTKADSLENVLFKQMKVMQALLSDEAPVLSSCVATQQEGIYLVTVEGGVACTVFMDNEECAGVLSYVEEENVKYWAVCGKDSEPVALKDKSGKKIAVSSALDVKVEGDELLFCADEQMYQTGYCVDDFVQAFTCSPLADDEGVVYAVVFDFGGDGLRTVYVSGYKGAVLYLPSDDSRTAISEMYVRPGGTASIAVDIAGGIEYEVIVPEGWTAEVHKDEALIDVTAPQDASMPETEEDALELKLVTADGIITFATLVLTVEPFRSVAVSVTDVVVVPSTGTGRYAYGISHVDDYDADAVLETAAGLISGEAVPQAGYAVADAAVSVPFAEIFGTSLDPEARYVLWAVADGGVLRSLEFGEIAVDIEVKATYLLDADLMVSVKGADAVYAGVTEKTDEMMDNILYQVQNSIFSPVEASQNWQYEGTAVDFPVADGEKNVMLPETEYVVWVVPVVSGEYTYTASDVFTAVITTNSVVSGGSLEVTCGEAEATVSSISVPVSCEGAAMIYYAWLDNIEGSRYAASDEVLGEGANALRYEQIMKSNRMTAVIGDDIVAVGKGMNEEAATTYWLYVVAVDEDGKYGRVHYMSASTLKLDYDTSISLTVDAEKVTSNSVTLKVTSSGGDLSDYIYWFGSAMDPFWANAQYCGNYSGTAQKYMALNPDDDNIVNAMRKYGKLSADGTIEIDGLTMETKYVFLILEKGEKYYSKIGYKSATTLAADLGTIVEEGTDKWNAARERISFEWNKADFEQGTTNMLSYYSFNITCPTEFTAYIMCGSEGYFEEMGLLKIEHHMIELENYSSRRVDKDHAVAGENGELMNEPDYYKDGVLKPGQLLNVNDFYVHGIPTEGAVTYFAQGTHGEGNCISWSGTECENYKRAEEKIAYYSSIEPYLIKAETFGLKGDEAQMFAENMLEAYLPFYEDAKPLIYINDGSPLTVTNPYATGVDEEGNIPDRVIVMLKDAEGNYYHPMYFEVPNYFE